MTIVPPGPSLKDFVLRSQVLNLYRTMIRRTRNLPVAQRDAVRSHMREEINSSHHLTDPDKIAAAISRGKTDLKHLDILLSMSHNTGSK